MTIDRGLIDTSLLGAYEAVGNIVDELMSAKKQALAAAFASM